MPPKYKALADTLRDCIKKEYAPGERLPTRKTLMERHAVSLATVEGALRILSDEHLIYSHAGSGTFVSKRTPKEKLNASGIICMFSAFPGQDITSNWHQGPIFDGIRSVLDKTEMRLMVSDYSSIGDAEYYSDFSALIFMAPTEDQKSIVKEFQGIGVPSVVISTSWEDVDIPSIDCDNEYGVRCALRYLADRGHTSIGYVDQVARSFDAIARRSALENMLAEFGIECNWHTTIDAVNIDNETLCRLREMTRLTNRPTAFLFSSLFPVTVEVVAELRRLGLCAPQDVSIIGFDDSLWAKCMEPALTVIRQPLYAMGRHAVERLLEQMSGEVSIKSEILPIELIERNSVAVIKTSGQKYQGGVKC